MTRFRMATALLCLILALVCGASVSAQAIVTGGDQGSTKYEAAQRGVDDNADINALARDVDRLESIRQVKDLQRTYAQYAEHGLWNEMASLFTKDASLIITAPGSGPVTSETVQGQAAIADWLTSRGGGRQGLAPGALDAEFIDNPVANLSVDGLTAKARWNALSFLGDGQGHATIAGGIYENEYARDGGVWKISVSHYFPHFTGPYEVGWTNVNGVKLPLVPYHFTSDETGIPVPPATGPAPHSSQSLSQLEDRINALNDEDAVRNLQHAYGYYVDRKMWDDVVDLFADDSAVEVQGVGTFRGRTGVRQAMEQLMGPSATAGAAGLKHGELNERPMFDTLVQVLPGGNEAYCRSIELGMLGEADKEAGRWTLSVYRNRFVKEDGLWKLKELRYYPVMNADYYTGWGSNGVLAQASTSVPAFLGFNPATHAPVNTNGLDVLGTHKLTSAINPSAEKDSSKLSNADRLKEARRKLSRSMAYDGTDNVNAAYGFYLDDMQFLEMCSIFAVPGNKQSPFAGFYVGRDRIRQAATVVYGTQSSAPRSGISFHWLTQQVILVSEDGRSTSSTTELFQPRTGLTVNPQGLFGAVFSGGAYRNNQSVLENGIWRLWSLAIDEPYFSMPNWKTGWAKVKDRAPGTAPSSILLKVYPPDVLLTQLGVREEHFAAGTGQVIQWPGILPMWFSYRNPVSGRVPEFYWPDEVPAKFLPDSRMTAHGYQVPPTGPGPEPSW